MPFIEQWRRDKINRLGIESLPVIEAGDRCYVFYKQLVDAWNKDPRWSTVHSLYRGLRNGDSHFALDVLDDRMAEELAWQVFFHTHVMPYERKKQKENGGIG